MPSNWQHDRRTTTERGYGWEWQKLRARIMARDMHLCQTCLREGRTTPAQECDHIKPKAEGGTDDPGNLEAICTECHKVKTDAEAARAQGRSVRRNREIGLDGWPSG